MAASRLSSRELAFIDTMRVGRMATIGADGAPSLVPICYAIVGAGKPALATVLDEKPKRVADAELARVRNIRRDPRVRLIVDRYDEDWSQLAFVRIDGRARIVAPEDPGHAAAITALRLKYPQYHSMAIEQRLVIVIEALRSASWGL